VLGAATSIVGSYQAMEALRVLLKQKSAATTETIHFDLENAENFNVKRSRDPNCPACGPRPRDFSYEEEDKLEAGEQTYAMLRGRPVTWVDIREIHEQDPSIEGSLRLPLSSLNRDFFADKKRAIVIYCQKGHRSRALLRELHAKGFDHVIGLKGGLEAFHKAEI